MRVSRKIADGNDPGREQGGTRSRGVRRHERAGRIGRLLVLSALMAPAGFSLLADESTPAGGPSSPTIKGGLIGHEHRTLLAAFVLPGVADQGAMRKGLRATQRMSCGWASASLVYRRDVVVFAAHQLYDDDKLSPDISKCAFEVTRIERGTVKIDRYPLLLDTLDHGDLADKPWTEGNVQDWAIARLARPVPDIEPYRLPEPGDDASPGRAVVTASRTTENWDGPSAPNDRLAQSCHAVAADPGLGGDQGVMHFDCDVGPGASGGAVLTGAPSGHPRYLGTLIAYSGKDCRRVGFDTCFSIGRQLDAELVARVRGTTALGTPEDARLVEAQAARLRAPRDAVADAAMSAVAAPFPAQSDPQGREVASLYTRICALDREGRAAEADPLLFQAFHTLRDPDRGRPEWPWLLLEAGRSLMARGRSSDAFQSFRMAEGVAPEAMKLMLRLQMGLSTPDAKERDTDLRAAYLAGGEALFRAAGAARELAAFKVQGVPTDVHEDADADD